MLRVAFIALISCFCTFSAAFSQCTGGGGAIWPGNVNPVAGTTFNSGTIQGSVNVNISVVGGSTSTSTVTRPMWNRGVQTYKSVQWRSLRITRGENVSSGNYTYFKLSVPLDSNIIHFRIWDIRGDGFNTEHHSVEGYLNGVPVTPNFSDLFQGAIIAGNVVRGPSTSTSSIQAAARIFFSGPVDSVVFKSVAVSDYIGLDIFSRCDILLPFKLSEFSAKKNGSVTDLSWFVEQASDFNLFEIERSDDGENWNSIGHKQLSDKNGGREKYLFTDLHPLNSKNFYRLKAIDFDGTVNYSAVASVNFSVGQVSLVGLGANPFQNELKIFNKTSEQLTVFVYSTEGRVIYNQRIKQGSVTIPTTSWAKGIYMVKVTANSGRTESFKLLHQ